MTLKAKELDETWALYKWVKVRQDAFKETVQTVAGRVYSEYPYLPDALDLPVVDALCWVIEGEEYLKPIDPPAFDRMNLREFTRYRHLLFQKQYLFQNEPACMAHLEEALVDVFRAIARQLPLAENPSPFTIPLAYALPNPGELIDRIYLTLGSPTFTDRGMFTALSDQLDWNYRKASGRDAPKSTKPLKWAAESDLPLDKLSDAYLAGTPFHRLFRTPVPLKLTHEDRYNHMHVVGGSGAGKTTLLETLILHDLQTPDPPTVVLIDPSSDVINRLLRADLGIEDRLVYLNPRDIHHPPALNVFAINRERHANYDEVTREQVTAGVIDTFDYLFSGLFELDLTGKQSVVFRNLTRFLLSFPDTMGRNATILDMLALTADDVASYLDAIRALPPLQREFMERDFLPKGGPFKQTKEQIRYRLQAIVENPTLARLFTAPETKVDLFAEMNRGAVIVVDTAKDFLRSGSSIFGKMFVSLILQAIQERAALPESERRPTFIFIDEAADVFSDDIGETLATARKYKAGLVLSHQLLSQASHKLQASLAANTGIKFASGLSASDASTMARDMRTTADFILNQPQLQFAAHIRNVTPHAVSIPVQVGTFAGLPKLSDEAYANLIERNRARVSLTTKASTASPAAPKSAAAPAPGESPDEW